MRKLKILWLTNIPLPEASLIMGEGPSPSGGWIVSVAKYLAKYTGVELSIAFPKKNIEHSIQKIIGKNITYYAFKPIKDGESNKADHVLKELVNEVKPNMVHIYGTELMHALSMVNVCNSLNVKNVISIQGLVSVISKHITASLPGKVIYGVTLRNLLIRDNVNSLRKIYRNRGKVEVEAIKKVEHVIGRTTWDKACTTQINPNINYHFCNETLRDEFYKNKWDLEHCEKYSIFLSQGHYPLKGLHYVIEALPIILKRFPNAKVYIGGKDITKSDSLKERLLITYYGKYIMSLIKKYKLENNIVFTGPLDEKKNV